VTGKLYGIGVGPGDPELMTLKAARILASSATIAYFAKAGNTSHARTIASTHTAADVEEMPLIYPVTTEHPRHDTAYIGAMQAFYETAADQIAARLVTGHDVTVISEGDPLFYGSYMHLHTRLAQRFEIEIVPGVTGMAGCWAMAQTPVAQGDDVFSIIPAILDEAELIRCLAQCDAAVIMKLGRNLPKVRRAIIAVGKLDQAFYCERGTMDGGFAVKLSDKQDDAAPYFSMILLPGWEKP
jgi:precorrin-2/cobalt-factor-2 C20-methyltransferase